MLIGLSIVGIVAQAITALVQGGSDPAAITRGVLSGSSYTLVLMVILGAVSSAGEYSRHGRGAVPLHGHRRRRGLRRPFIIDPILAAVTTYSEYTATASAAAMLDPDTHQTAQPEFGAAIALMVF